MSNSAIADTRLSAVEAGKAEFDQLRSEARRTHPALYAKIEAARDTPARPRG
jgi:hypothetical protein